MGSVSKIQQDIQEHIFIRVIIRNINCSEERDRDHWVKIVQLFSMYLRFYTNKLMSI